MKILFVMFNGGFIRNYEGVLRQLATEGHQVHIAIEVVRSKMNETVLGERLASELPNVTMGRAAVPDDTHWSRAARTGRTIVDYLRYLDPRFRDAHTLRRRAFGAVDKAFRPFVAVAGRTGSRGAAVLTRLLTAFERVVPLSDSIRRYLDEQHPDVLLLTPLVEPGSIQVDYIKSARQRGIPTALCVASWDNLTNKGAMRVIPDRVFVWNEPQREEAVTLHGVPGERVAVTGAQIFDHWFEWQPSRTREAFCRQVGLDPGRPFVLYLGSSFPIAPREASFGLRWIEALRTAADPVVAGAGILIRPHPFNSGQWYGIDLQRWPNAAAWPPAGVDMSAPEFKHDFYDSVYHCSAVVGVNTSAQIEAAIVGRAVCTVRAEDFAHSQAGTPHFQHLLGGGLLQEAQTLDEHVAQLGVILRNPEAQAEKSRAFVEHFVRPFGRDVAAKPRLAAAIVKLGTVRTPVRRPSATARLLAPVLLPVVHLVNWLPERRPLWAYAMRPFVHVWVQQRVRAHNRAEREEQQRIRATQVAKEQDKAARIQQRQAEKRALKRKTQDAKLKTEL